MVELLVLAFLVYLIKRCISKVFDLAEGLFATLPFWSRRQPTPSDQLTGPQNNAAQKEAAQTAVSRDSAKAQARAEKKEPAVGARPQPPTSKLVEEKPAERVSLLKQEAAPREQPQQEQPQVAEKPEAKPQPPRRESSKAELSNLLTGSSQSLRRSTHIKDPTIEREESRISEESKCENKQRYFRKFEEVESPQPAYRDSRLEEYELTIEQLRREIEGYKEEKKMYIERIEDIIQHVSQSQDQPINSEELVKTQDEELLAIRNLKIEINNAHQLEREKEQLVAQQLQETLDREKERIRNDYEEQMLQLRTQLENKRQEEIKLVREFENYRKELEGQRQKSTIQVEAQEDNSYQYRAEIDQLRRELEEEKRISDSAVRKMQQEIEIMQTNSFDNERQISELKDRLISVENDKAEIEMRLTTENDSLKETVAQLEKTIKEAFEAKLVEEQRKEDEFKQKYNQYVDKFSKELEEAHNRHHSELDEEKIKYTRKLEEVQEELRFCQEQIQQFQLNENKLREELDNARATPTPKRSERSYLSGSEVQNHPEYLKVKSKLETLESELKRNEKSEMRIEETSPKFEDCNKLSPAEKKINYARPLKERDPSPSFPSGSREVSSPAEVRSNSRAESSLSVNSREKMNSVILAGVFDRQPVRYQTPLEKPVVQSTVFEGGIMSETFFGETNILNEKKRKFVIGEINRLKKISAKKTKLLYRSLARNNKPITDFTSNVPNLFIVVELANKKVVGAFTQTAFTKDLAHSPEKSKYVSQNKAMIMDITNERVFPNQSGHETIRHDSNALIWGRNELVVNCEEPLLLASDLNCEAAIYACDYSAAELLGGDQNSFPISQFEVFRIFLG